MRRSPALAVVNKFSDTYPRPLLSSPGCSCAGSDENVTVLRRREDVNGDVPAERDRERQGRDRGTRNGERRLNGELNFNYASRTKLETLFFVHIPPPSTPRSMPALVQFLCLARLAKSLGVPSQYLGRRALFLL